MEKDIQNRFKITREHTYILVTTLVILIGVFGILPAILGPDTKFPKDFHVQTLWTHRIGSSIYADPVLVNNTLILGTEKSVDAIDASTGKPVWSIPMPDNVISLAKDTDGIIYAGTGFHEAPQATFSAIDAGHGHLLWQKSFVGHIEEPPTIDTKHHRLWMGSGPGSLWSLDTHTGDILWHRDIGHMDATPLLKDDTLYVPAQKNDIQHESFFYAINAANGDMRWYLEQAGQPWAAPLFDKTGHTILTNTGEGQIGVTRPSDKGQAQAISQDGHVMWQTDLPDMALTPNIYLPNADLLIHVLKNGTLIALNTTDGRMYWTAKIAKGFMAPATFFSHAEKPYVAVVSSDGFFFLIHAMNGRIAASIPLGQSARTAPVINNDIIYVATQTDVTALRIDEENQP